MPGPWWPRTFPLECGVLLELPVDREQEKAEDPGENAKEANCLEGLPFCEHEKSDAPSQEDPAEPR